MKGFVHVRVALLLLTINFLSKGQDVAVFEKTYDRISTETAQKNLDAALVSADSLYSASNKPLLQIRSLILIARLYQQKEDLNKSIEYVLKAEQLATETGDYTWQAKANSYLAGLYRMIELYEKSKSYSEKALKIIPYIKDPEQANSTRGLMLQELSFANMDQGNHKQAIGYLQQAAQSINKLKKNRGLNLLNNERLLGDNYRLLASYDSALIHYRKAIALSSAVPVGYVTCLVYKGIAETLLEKGDLREVKGYLDKAQKIADESQYLQIQESVYDLSKQYYARVKDQNGLVTAREKKDSVTGILLDKRAGLLDGMYSEVEQEGVRMAMINGQKNIAILISVVLLLACIAFFIMYRRKQKTELARVKQILEQQNNRKSQQGEEQNTLGSMMALQLAEDTSILPVKDDK
ncbi:tetratricopeptide repeat protein [Dyadobacter sp. CY312]|uniref:tetratricopeptide repeat protein n=1 Tax=Dyadobacter sp. CY312 TaxID=2907303 RepID=UPI001F1A5104|nr:tetratricopeptide repeat protein [Dyadobacter sp. CY312]MCE7039133.1 tetratricopeptide repeat protein [Dyadobacter sp. CY312]